MNVIIFGPNGSGKGTQSSLIKNEFGLSHIESGDLFRENISNKTDLGLQAKQFIDKGELVPDEITIPMILSTLEKSSGNGWLLDGFPRNKNQAIQLIEAIDCAGLSLDCIVVILLDRAEAKKRIMGRRICVNNSHHPNNIHIPSISPSNNGCRICQGNLVTRPDDQDEDAINKRHNIYYDSVSGTLAAIDVFKKMNRFTFIEVKGDKSIDEIQATLISKIKGV
mgnify:CR=1 FL=1